MNLSWEDVGCGCCDLTCRGRGRWNGLTSNLGLGLAERNSDLWRAAGRAERSLIFYLAPATIAVVFHNFTLQEPTIWWQIAWQYHHHKTDYTTETWNNRETGDRVIG